MSLIGWFRLQFVLVGCDIESNGLEIPGPRNETMRPPSVVPVKRGNDRLKMDILTDAFYERARVKIASTVECREFLAKGDDEYHRQFWL